MTELLVRTSRAPAAITVVELEGPSRIFTTAATASERRALRAWIDADPVRQAIVAAGLAAQSLGGGAERAQRWSRTLRREHDGVDWLAKRLVLAERRLGELERRLAASPGAGACT